MKTETEQHHFTLVLSGVHEGTEGLEDALFNAGCDDALLYFKAGVTYLEFDREADSLKNAVASATKQAESTGLGIKVVNGVT